MQRRDACLAGDRSAASCWPRLRINRHARARGAARRTTRGSSDERRLPRRAVGAGLSADTITVVLADDQRVVREGLAMVLGLMSGVEVLGSASDGEEAIALAEQLTPQVVLMDLRMPRVDGVEATKHITERQPETKVVVLTTYADDHTVIQALR